MNEEKKKHQGKLSLVCIYVSLSATTDFTSDATRDIEETASIDKYPRDFIIASDFRVWLGRLYHMNALKSTLFAGWNAILSLP